MKDSELKYVEETAALLKTRLSDEPQEMVNQMREAEGRVGYCYYLLAQANAELDRQTSAAAEVLKAENLKAYVLEAKVEATVSGWREERDKIQGLIKALEGRTMTGLGILRYLRSLPME